MSQLTPCPECQRHVRKTESRCPFCEVPLSLAHLPEPALPRKRLGRAATFAFGASVVGATALVGCGEDSGSIIPVYGAPLGGNSFAGGNAVYGAPASGSSTGGTHTGDAGAGAGAAVYGAPAGAGGEASGGEGGSGGASGAGGDGGTTDGGFGGGLIYGGPPSGAGGS